MANGEWRIANGRAPFAIRNSPFAVLGHRFHRPNLRGGVMTIAAAFFWLFAFVMVASAAMVIFARNPVHAVLFLILAFFNAAGLVVLLGAEFLAMMLVVVYVGAVAVLFLFVVMMLDINFVALRQGFVRYLPIGAVVGLILVAELIFIFGGWANSPGATAALAAPTPAMAEVSNTQALGRLLYTQY